MTPPPAHRGALIVFEGLDRSGKSTQVASLVTRLNALRGSGTAVAMRFPDRSTPTGKLIDAYLSNTSSNDTLDDRTIHLLFAANRSEAMQNLRTTLWSGTSVILDRYVYSGVAYSQAKGLEQEWCMGVDAGCIQPDVVFFLDLTPKDAAMRTDYGIERYEKVDFQEKVREYFLALVDKSYWRVLDTRQSKEALGVEILELALSEISNAGTKPLLPLSLAYKFQW